MTSYELYRNEGKHFRSVRVQVDDEGFTIETQDIGPTTEQFWGDSDYEFWTTVPREEWDKLLMALAREFLANEPKATDRLADICKRHDIKYTWASWA